MKVSTHMIPSAWLLQRMIDRAMAECDADREQALLAKEEQENERYARGVANETEARRRQRLYGEAAR